MSNDVEPEESLQTFVDLNWITEILGPLRSGKEATVYACRAHPSTGVEFLAAKRYRAQQHRSFRNDAAYQEGRWRKENRVSRAFRNKSDFGREVQLFAWVDHEWETLRALHAAGTSVPRPLARSADAILMEFLGEEGRPAPPLRSASLTREEGRVAFAAVLADVERMLACNVVHGDLSGFNILWAGGCTRIIDLPQAVDPRFNHAAREFLARDVENVCQAFARFGVPADPAAIAGPLWRRFLEGRL